MVTKLIEASKEHQQGAPVIDLRGDIARSAEEVLNRAYEEAITDGAHYVILNFEGVDYINSTGIAVIVGLLARARKEKRTVATCGLTQHYREIFEITRLADFVDIYTDKVQATARGRAGKEGGRMPELSVSMEVRPADGASIIDIKGDLTAGAEDVLMAAYNEAMHSDPKAIVLNFSNLKYMNSGGIGLLVTLLVRVNRQDQKLLAFGLNDHYRQIFELTRLDEAISINSSEHEALASGRAEGRNDEHVR